MTKTNNVARTSGAKRAGAGECVFELARVSRIVGGPDYSSAVGACAEGDRMIVGLNFPTAAMILRDASTARVTP